MGQPEEPMKLDQDKIKKLMHFIADNEEFAPFGRELLKINERKEKERNKLLCMKYCDHRWHIPDKVELKKHRFASCIDRDKYTDEEISEIVMQYTSYCEKCDLPYRYRNVDIDNALKAFDDGYYASIGVHYHFGAQDCLSEADKIYQEELDIKIADMEKEYNQLKKEVEEIEKAKKKEDPA